MQVLPLKRLFAATLLLLTISCAPKSDDSNNGVAIAPADTNLKDTINPPAGKIDHQTDVLLFNGQGISTSDWQTSEKIIKSMGLSYRLINSAQLNAMSLNEMSKFGLILVPGGHGSTITNGLSSSARVRVRKAVRENGTSYLGICAGAWVAVGMEADSEVAQGYGFSAIGGNHLSNWWPYSPHPEAAMAMVTFADGSKRSLVWYGGPSTPEWRGGVVARYKDGRAAISQAWSKNGFVILSGPHPEAPQGWRVKAGNDPDGLDYDIMRNLVSAALNKRPLKTY